MLRIPALAASLSLVIALLGGCALLEDVGDSDLDDALELVPGEATSVVFQQGGAGPSSAPHVDQDVVWQVVAVADPGTVRGYKMDDDLDLDAVGDDLADAGYAEDELAGHRRLVPDDPSTPAVVLVPDEHLVLVARSTEALEAALDVLEDDADSLTDSGAFDDLLAEVDDPDYAALTHEPECGAGGPDLGTPESMGFFRFDGSETMSVLAFEDDEAAEADLEAREAYVTDELAELATWDLERDDNVVRVSYDYDDPDLALRAARQYDGFHVCGTR